MSESGIAHILRFDSLPSTNQYCESLDPSSVEAFTVVWALSQPAGIGQQGNRWESEPGQNLTFSLLLKPTELAADQQFTITQLLSVGITDWLLALLPHTLHDDVHIKWPNDIYVGHRKLGGILVSNRLHGHRLQSSICGIGLNINQTHFPQWVPNPTSVALLTGQTMPLESTLHDVVGCIARRYEALRSGDANQLLTTYLDRLLNYCQPANYLYRSTPLRATIVGTTPLGLLRLVDEDDRLIAADLKELQYLFPSE